MPNLDNDYKFSYTLNEQVHIKGGSMPKIIDEAKQVILAAAKKRLFSNGINDITVRAVAKDSHIATGTFYNYFKNKEMLIAEIMLDDWMDITEKANGRCKKCASPMEGIEIIYDALIEFSDKYKRIFEEQRLTGMTKNTFDGRHALLVGKLSEMLKISFDKFSVKYDSDLLTFISESILIEANYRYPFNKYKKLVGRLIKYKEGHNNEQL